MKKTDPRIIRTRHLLANALMTLIERKGYEAITITDIAQEATLNRSTFYMHYRDKDELMQSIIAQVLEHIEHVPRLKSQSEPYIDYIQRLYTYLFEHVQQHHAFYKIMLRQRSVAGFTQQMQQHIEALGLQWLTLTTWQQKQTPPELFMSFVGAGFMGLIRWWIQHDMPYSPDYMAKQFMKFTLFGMHRDFGIPYDDTTMPD